LPTTTTLCQPSTKFKNLIKFFIFIFYQKKKQREQAEEREEKDRKTKKQLI